MSDLITIPPLFTYYITAEHCRQARAMLGWEQDELAQRSGVSLSAIQRFEEGIAPLNDVTLQALAFRLEQENLIFIPEHPPLRCGNVKGCTPDPRSRQDFQMVE
ncbi:helix-turn-helix transcriptional regulator [Pseudomonas stutzeri]|uniref:helix-turn-helix domain-containing protein n=1 Tax=Stutzerimonas stutzeri TaxID=316 RepID=UPI00210E4DAA|nr:helix-turn-helix transcriptional regulator [Stutzerimonas stutzeri]MCQ4310930.1 helix-turn-helix transcriptional regulator [Stutzerimonas stutzeri]